MEIPVKCRCGFSRSYCCVKLRGGTTGRPEPTKAKSGVEHLSEKAFARPTVWLHLQATKVQRQRTYGQFA